MNVPSRPPLNAELQSRGLIRATLHLVNREFDALADDFVTLGLLPPGSDKDVIVPALTGVFQVRQAALRPKPCAVTCWSVIPNATAIVTGMCKLAPSRARWKRLGTPGSHCRSFLRHGMTLQCAPLN